MTQAKLNRQFLSISQMISGVAILGVALFLLKVGCDRARTISVPNEGLNTVEMQIGSKTFNLEIAATDPARERGLMRRDSIPADHGMIFVFPEEKERAFWMKNTRIPLDIIYVASNGRVVSVKQMKAYNTKSVPSDGAAKYAIEVNAGAAEEAGVGIGDELTIPAAARDATE